MRILLMICLIAGLAACSGITKEKLGIAQKVPNEQLVEERAPLSLPPEFHQRPTVLNDNPAGER